VFAVCREIVNVHSAVRCSVIRPVGLQQRNSTFIAPIQQYTSMVGFTVNSTNPCQEYTWDVALPRIRHGALRIITTFQCGMRCAVFRDTDPLNRTVSVYTLIQLKNSAYSTMVE